MPDFEMHTGTKREKKQETEQSLQIL